MATLSTPVGPIPAGREPDEYDRLRRRVLWMLPSGLYLVGSCAGGVDNLMTLNWATQVSLEPKAIAVSVEGTALTNRLIDEGAVFALSIIAREDFAVVRRFVKPAKPGPAPGQLNGFAIRRATTGAPILSQALAWLDCRVTHRVAVGGHTLFVGEVVDAGTRPAAEQPAAEQPAADHDGTASETAIGVLRMEDTRMNYGG